MKGVDYLDMLMKEAFPVILDVQDEYPQRYDRVPQLCLETMHKQFPQHQIS
jgi:hypothetical protein